MVLVGVSCLDDGSFFISEEVIRFESRVADSLRELDPFKSSADRSFPRRGRVPYLSRGQLAFASKAIVPTRVLIESVSGATEVARPELRGVVLPLPPTEGQRPSSVGVPNGVLPRVTEGVLDTLTLCKAGVPSFIPVGKESGFTGRLVCDTCFGTAVVLPIVALEAVTFSRDLARSRTFNAEVGGVFKFNEIDRPREEALDRELLLVEAPLSADFLGDLVVKGSFIATFFLVILPAFLSELTGPPVTEELSLPPSLAQ